MTCPAQHRCLLCAQQGRQARGRRVRALGGGPRYDVAHGSSSSSSVFEVVGITICRSSSSSSRLRAALYNSHHRLIVKHGRPHGRIFEPPLQAGSHVEDTTSGTGTRCAHGLALPANVFDLPLACRCCEHHAAAPHSCAQHPPLSHSKQTSLSSSCCSTRRPPCPSSSVSS